jgi:hypothetical protein
VTVTWPTNNYPNAGKWMNVKAFATSSKVVTAMQILVDGKVATTINNVTSVNNWVFGSVGAWHTIQVQAWTNGAWVKSSTLRVHVSY